MRRRPGDKVERVPVVFPDRNVPAVAYSRPLGAPGRYHVHTDDDWELCYIATGDARYRLGQEEVHLEAGDMLLIQPDDPHACLSWHGERFVVIFRRALLRETGLATRCGRAIGLQIAGVRIPPRTTIAPWRRASVEYLLDRLQQESFGSEPAKRPMWAALLAQLLLELARNESERRGARPPPPDSAAHRVVERMAAIVRADICGDWTLPALVRRSGYSSTQLGVLFRRATGLSPCEWIAQERVHQACQLLVHSAQTATRIAADVGFGTRSQFHRVFRRVTGTTPERYRSALHHEIQP